jgi:hypothetical protein
MQIDTMKTAPMIARLNFMKFCYDSIFQVIMELFDKLRAIVHSVKPPMKKQVEAKK